MSSLYYEDFSDGREFTSRGRTITEADIVAFAGLSGDFLELHTNEEHARQSMFARRIAHGALIFSVSTGLVAQMNLVNDSVLAFYGLDRLRFTRPVFIGDTVHVHKRVLERQDKGSDKGVIAFETTVLNQLDEPVIVYQDRLLVRKRSA